MPLMYSRVDLEWLALPDDVIAGVRHAGQAGEGIWSVCFGGWRSLGEPCCTR